TALPREVDHHLLPDDRIACVVAPAATLVRRVDGVPEADQAVAPFDEDAPVADARYRWKPRDFDLLPVGERGLYGCRADRRRVAAAEDCGRSDSGPRADRDACSEDGDDPSLAQLSCRHSNSRRRGRSTTTCS